MHGTFMLIYCESLDISGQALASMVQPAFRQFGISDTLLTRGKVNIHNQCTFLWKGHFSLYCIPIKVLACKHWVKLGIH
jgi:hypothetical protein